MRVQKALMFLSYFKSTIFSLFELLKTFWLQRLKLFVDMSCTYNIITKGSTPNNLHFIQMSVQVHHYGES